MMAAAQLDRIIICLLMAIAFIPFNVKALEQSAQADFDRIAVLEQTELSRETQTLLNKKYPDTSWQQYKIPDYAHKNRAVLVAYRIATIEPHLLRADGCYCLCEPIGHKSLKNCFIKEEPGWLGGRYDEHGANCDICVTQAMLTFLWKNLGATDEEVAAGIEKKFSWIVEKYGTQ